MPPRAGNTAQLYWSPSRLENEEQRNSSGERREKMEDCEGALFQLSVYVFNVRRCTKVETESIQWGWWL